MEELVFVNVIVPLKVDGYFTYLVPKEWKQQVDVGKRVLVQFGKRKIYTALIISVHSDKPNYETKPLIAVLDEFPVVTDQQLQLWEWISRYYLCPLGEVMKAALPSGLKLESESIICKGNNFELFEPYNEDEVLLKNIIEQKEFITIEEFQKKTKKKNITILINRLLTNQFIAVEEEVKEKHTVKKAEYLVLSDEINTEEQVNKWFYKLQRAKKQSDVLFAYLALNNGQWNNLKPIRKTELLKKAKDNGTALKALVKKGVLQIIWIEESRVLTETLPETQQKIILSPEQEEVKNKILEHFIDKSVVLLHGVTGSGKTEIYIKLIEETIRQNKQVLYLLPEIALTSHIVKRLQSSLGERVVVYHSKINENERTEWYLHLLKNPKQAKVVLGVRSSLFLPFQNLGLIIVDEEHEPTYKQQSSAPFYHARDMAIVLGKLFASKVLLGSATPSVESYFNALNGKYALVELLTRYGDVELPQIQIINLREERKKKRVSLSFYSQTMLQEIKSTLSRGKQCIIFQNRRGYAPYIECQSCGWIPGCSHCDVKLTYHKVIEKLVCHYCGYNLPVPMACKSCHLPELKVRGVGTERIEDELMLLLPDANIARMDLDTTRTKNKIEQLLIDFEQKKYDVLVGTQMVTKGLDFEHVELIGIIDADAMLNFPDFRTNERSFQLFAQVAGRAGRRDKQGKVLIQTSQPQHPVLRFLKDYDYKGFITWQLNERKQFHYPSFVRLIKIQLKHKQKEWVEKVAKTLAESLKKEKNLNVVGPQWPVISKIQNLYIIDLWLKLQPAYNILKNRDRLYYLIYSFFSRLEYKNILWQADVDPW